MRLLTRVLARFALNSIPVVVQKLQAKKLNDRDHGCLRVRAGPLSGPCLNFDSAEQQTAPFSVPAEIFPRRPYDVHPSQRVERNYKKRDQVESEEQS
jgi:hypothetical protein